ncbi:beta-propeller fold lactonase family protein [Hydrogenophaga palleronii]|uniref:beta-propeller fold lactonase family protein n=1 Tax=Hydrogenophaga palleronii TaxID=65655 RepID=UPI000825D0FF|nr:beta-propeller fold lactonase family protein [Hydrogenophaga palleronii]
MLLAACGGSGDPGPAVPYPDNPPKVEIPPALVTVGGTLSGLRAGQQIVLRKNGADLVTITGNGSFQFPVSIPYQSAYNVTLDTVPANLTCTLSNASGSRALANVTNVGVSCTAVVAESWVYIPDAGNDQILGYSIDRTTGTRTDLPGSPYPAGDNNRWIAMNPAKTFVYTTNGGSHNVSAYTVNASTGELTPVAGSPYATGSTPWSIEVSPDGRFAYVANSNDASVSGYSIHQTTGALTPMPGSPFAAGFTPSKIAITPDSRHLYVINHNGYTVTGFGIDATTGALVPLAGSPWSTTGHGQGVAVHPSGDFLYVANFQASLNVYRINPADGALTDLVSGGQTTAASSWEWLSVTTNGTGTVGYVATSQGIRQFDIDTASGALSEQAAQPNNVRTQYVTTNRAGTRLYSSDIHTTTVHIADIAAGTGSLTALPNSPYTVGAEAHNLVVIEP